MMVLAMKKPVSKLVDLEIDEVSVVDRGANQHSLIAFSKSLAAGAHDAEDGMSATFIDENGVEVDEGELQVGDVIVDEDGNEFEIVPADALDDFDGEDVGKAIAVNAAGEATKLGRVAVARNAARRGAWRAERAGREMGTKARRRARDFYMQPDYTRGTISATGYGIDPGRSVRMGRVVGTAGAGAALAGAGGAGAYGYSRTKKSLGDDILDDFSKALTDRDREVVFAKMADEVEKAHAAAEEAMSWAEAEHDARLTEVFISKAAEYNLPVDAEVFGPILKSIAQTLDDEDLEVLDALFHAIGDALYDEIGYVGESSNSSVLDQVNAYADDLVTKADVSHAQAMTAMFETNPTAYDAYIAEMGR